MNKLWLKIIGFAVLIITVIIVVNAFWPIETQIEDGDTRDWEAKATEQYPEAEKLYQMALSRSKSGDPQDDRKYALIIDCCRQILTQYPDSPQAKKARELLQEVPEQYRKQYEKEMILRYSSKPAVRKSRPLRRRVSRSYPRLHYIPGEDINRPD